MKIEREKIDLIIKSTKELEYLVDFLSPLEIDRLIDLIADTLNKIQNSMEVDIHNPQSLEEVERLLIDTLNKNRMFFGNVYIAEIIDLDILLKSIYKS